jgi:isochorismatase
MPVLDIVDFVEYILDWSGQVEVLYFEEFKNRN